MLSFLRNLMGGKPAEKPSCVPAGQRVYAVGDIHGHVALFEDLISLIEADDLARGPAETTVILLGDLIDRGPESARVVARARTWADTRQIAFIIGNHEEMLLASLADGDALRGFLRYGGMETLQSYGIAAREIMNTDIGELQAMMLQAIPADDLAFLEAFQPMIRIGDFPFVHAGVTPGLPLDDQDPRSCRWIREPFLSHRGDLGAVVVHGHTISDEPEIKAHRIGIDTGAYMSGTLTALGLEGDRRWFLQARNAAAYDPAVAGSID